VERLSSAKTKELDALNDLSEDAMLRLQNYLDRRSRAYEILQTLMRQISETQSQIINNLK
jgi:hypothetical protein